LGFFSLITDNAGRRHAKRSVAAAVSLSSAPGPMAPQRTPAQVAARTGRLKRLRYNDAQNVTVALFEHV